MLNWCWRRPAPQCPTSCATCSRWCTWTRRSASTSLWCASCCTSTWLLRTARTARCSRKTCAVCTPRSRRAASYSPSCPLPNSSAYSKTTRASRFRWAHSRARRRAAAASSFSRARRTSARRSSSHANLSSPSFSSSRTCMRS